MVAAAGENQAGGRMVQTPVLTTCPAPHAREIVQPARNSISFHNSVSIGHEPIECIPYRNTGVMVLIGR